MPRQLLLVVALAKEVWIYKWNVEEKEKMDMDEVKRIKIMQLFKIRGRLLKKEGMHAFHNFGAWAIYHDSVKAAKAERQKVCLLYTSPSPRDQRGSRMPSSA